MTQPIKTNKETTNKRSQNTSIHKNALNIVTLLIAIFALINSEWGRQEAHYLNKNTVSRQSKQAAQNQTILANRIKSMVDEEANLKTNIMDAIKDTNALNKKVSTMDELLHRALQSEGQKKNYFSLLEAHHLLTLAELSLNWQQDIPGSITLLEGIDQNLTNINRIDVSNLRKMVHHSITELKAVKPTDKVRLLSQLSALGSQSETLKFIQTKLTPQDNLLTTNTSNQNNDSPLKNAWLKTLSSLSKVVILKHNTKPIEPIVSNEDMELISQSIIMALEQAGWAALRNKQTLYNYNLDKASSLISTYFSSSHQASSMLATIDTLKTIELNPKLPNLTPIAVALENLMQSGDKS